MMNTLVIYEGTYGTAEKVAYNVGMIVGNTKVVSIETAPRELTSFQNVILVFSFRGYDTLSHTKPYLREMEEKLRDKKMAVIGVGLAPVDLKHYMKVLNEFIVVEEQCTYFVTGHLCIRELSEEDCKVLQAFTEKMKMPFQDMGKLNLQEVADVGTSIRNQFRSIEKPMSQEMLEQEIEGFIKKHNMLALTTGSGNEVRCSPVEYIYNNKCFYIITEGGLKFRGLTQNNKVSFGIYDTYEGMNKLGGLQVTAYAEMIPLLCDEYIKIMGVRGVNLETIHKLPIDLYVIKLVPNTYEFLYSPLKERGYDAKQYMEVGQEE